MDDTDAHWNCPVRQIHTKISPILERANVHPSVEFHTNWSRYDWCTYACVRVLQIHIWRSIRFHYFFKPDKDGLDETFNFHKTTGWLCIKLCGRVYNGLNDLEHIFSVDLTQSVILWDIQTYRPWWISIHFFPMRAPERTGTLSSPWKNGDLLWGTWTGTYVKYLYIIIRPIYWLSSGLGDQSCHNVAKECFWSSLHVTGCAAILDFKVAAI